MEGTTGAMQVVKKSVENWTGVKKLAVTIIQFNQCKLTSKLFTLYGKG
jgi:hypothetical protein